MKDKTAIYCELLAFLVFILIFFPSGRFNFGEAIEVNRMFIANALVSFMIAVFVGWVSFREGERAERGETKNVNEIMELLPAVADEKKVILSRSAFKDLEKLKESAEYSIIQNFIRMLQAEDFAKVKSCINVHMTRGGVLEARAGKNRIHFIKKGNSYFISSISSKRKK